MRARGHIFCTCFHLAKTQRVMRLFVAVRRQLESSSYGLDGLHFERSKVNLDLVSVMPEILIKSRFEGKTRLKDICGVALNALGNARE